MVHPCAAAGHKRQLGLTCLQLGFCTAGCKLRREGVDGLPDPCTRAAHGDWLKLYACCGFSHLHRVCKQRRGKRKFALLLGLHVSC